MHILIIYAFWLSAVNAPPIGPFVLPPQNNFVIPPTMVAAEFSTLAACQAAGQNHIAAMRQASAPLILTAGFTCNKKSL